MKQTAVEWLMEKMMHPDGFNPYIEQALEMEKEQSQKYAEFAVMCDREEIPILEFEEFIKHF